jgi:hypothetical protein
LRGTPRFWAAYRELPTEIRQAARKMYLQFRENPAHPSHNFKKVHNWEPVYSVRVTYGYRAVGLPEGGEVTWFWIGHTQPMNVCWRRCKTPDEGVHGHGFCALLLEQCSDIATPVQDVHNSDAGVGETVENQVLAYREAAIAGSQIVTASSRVRMGSEQCEVVGEEVDEPISGEFVVFGNVNPDGENVAACAPG